MTDQQWQDLQAVISGETRSPLPVGFIIDSPWLPGWHGVEIADYLPAKHSGSRRTAKPSRRFPSVWFLPGFWSEFGMCTEPSAFGSRCVFPRNEFPFAEKIINRVEQIADFTEPNPATDGLLPFMLNRLRWARPRIEDLGHKIRFSVSRGPLNVATFLMGTTEFLMAIKTDPEPAHRLLRVDHGFPEAMARAPARDVSHH